MVDEVVQQQAPPEEAPPVAETVTADVGTDDDKFSVDLLGETEELQAETLDNIDLLEGTSQGLGLDQVMGPKTQLRMSGHQFALDADNSGKGLDQQTALTTYIGNDKFDRTTARNSSLRQVLIGGTDADTAMAEAERLIQEPVEDRVVSEIYTDRHFPGSDEQSRMQIGNAFLAEDVQYRVLDSLGADPEKVDYNTFMSQPSTAVANFMNQAIDGGRTRREIYTDLLQEQNPKGDKVFNSFGELIVMPGEEITTIPTILISSLPDEGVSTQALPDSEDDSLKTIARYLTLAPVDPKIEVDAMALLKGLFTFDADSLEEFADQMEGRHGDDWMAKVATFTAKEVGLYALPAYVIAALLAPEIAAVAAVAAAGVAVSRKVRFMLGLKRAVLVGASYEALGRTTDETLLELAEITEEPALLPGVRFVGELTAGPINLVANKVLTEPARKVLAIVSAKLNGIRTPVNPFTKKNNFLPIPEAATRAAEQTGVADQARKIQAQVAKELSDDIGSTVSKELTGGSTLDNINMVTGQFKFLENGDGIGLRVMGEVTSRQNAARDIFFTEIAPDGLFRFRDTPFKEATGAFAKGANLLRVGEPEDIVGPVMRDLFDVSNRAAGINSSFTRMRKEVLKGLPKESKEKLEDALMRGSDAEKVFITRELDYMGLTPDEQDAYYAMRALINFSGEVLDEGVTRQANIKGFRKLGDEIVFVKSAPKDGKVLVEALDPQTGVRGDIKTVDFAALKDIDTLLAYRPGYIPRSYKDANYHVSIYNTETKNISRIAGFKTRQEADNFTRKIQTDPGANPSEIAFYDKFNESTQAFEMGVPKQHQALLDNLDDSSMSGLVEAITNADMDDVARKSILTVFDKAHGGQVLRGHAARRGEVGLTKTLEVKPALEAITDYVSAVAEQNTKGPWREWTKREFMKEFGNKLGLTSFSDEIPQAFFKTKPQLANRAQRVQSNIKRFITGKTSAERAFDNAMDNLARRQLETPSGRITQKFMEGSTRALGINNLAGALTKARGITAYPKLVLFAVPQMVIQSSQAVFSVASRLATPRSYPAVLQATKDVMTAGALRTGETFGVKWTREQRALMTDIRRGGYLVDLDSSDWANIWMDSTVAAKVMRAPIVLGEGANRMVAFTISRREAMAEFKRGTFKDINDKPFKGAFFREDGSIAEEAMRVINDRAKATALNLNKSAQPELFSGVGSVGLQFAQILPKSARVLFGSELSRSQQLSVAAGLMAVYGTEGVPIIPDLVSGLDTLAFNTVGNKKPTKRELVSDWITNAGDWLEAGIARGAEDLGLDADEFRAATRAIRRVTQKGIVSELTDGEVELAHRIGMGHFIGDYMDNIDRGNITDAIPALSTLSQAMHGGATLVDVIQSGFRDELPAEAVAAQSLRQVGRTFTAVSGMSLVWNNSRKEFVDPEFRRDDPSQTRNITLSSGVRTNIPVTNTRLAILATGILPGPVAEDFSIRQRIQKYQQASEAWLQQFKQDWKDAQGNVKEHDRLVKELLDEAQLYKQFAPGRFGVHMPKNFDPVRRARGVVKQMKLRTGQ